MRNLTFILFYTVFLLTACGNSKKQSKEENADKDGKKEQKDAINEKSVKLKTEKKEFKGDDYTISYEVITEGSEALKKNVHSLLLKLLCGETSKSQTIEEFEKQVKNKQYSVKSEYCENASREFKAGIIQIGAVVSLEVSEYEFQCGSHGLGSISTRHFHEQTGKEITLKDIVKDEKGLLNEVETQFCKDNKLKKSAEAYVAAGYDGFAGGFKLAQNYSFSNDGITFSYNPYEAGPYTLPPFDVKVKYEKIKLYLLDNNPLGMK